MNSVSNFVKESALFIQFPLSMFVMYVVDAHGENFVQKNYHISMFRQYVVTDHKRNYKFKYYGIM